MHIFILCFLSGSFGALVGLMVANWARKLPQSFPDHTFCDERFQRMVKRYRHELKEQENEISRLVRGMS